MDGERIDKFIVEEPGNRRNPDHIEGIKLGYLATVKTNFKDADFWLTRRGNAGCCGCPVSEFSKEHIGIKVNRTDILLPKFLYYWMMNLYNQGYWRKFECGVTRLQNIQTRHVKNLILDFKSRRNPGHIEWVRSLAETGDGEFSDYYPETAAGKEVLDESDLYHGRNVIWDGYDGRMMKARPEHIQHIFGNNFDKDKLAAVIRGINEAEERVIFTAPYGTATKIGLLDVKESIEYKDDEGLDRPYTTGDEELDRYLVDPEEVLNEYADPDDPEYEEKKEEFDEALKEAVAFGEGDLGEWAITVRDGNHRAFGALLAGEPYVWVIMSNDQYQDFKEGVSPELEEILE